MLLHTRAQGALLGFASNERVTALREVLRQLLQFSEPVRHLVSLMYALDTRYDTGCPHPLAGGWRPDLARRPRTRSGRRNWVAGSWSTSPGTA